MTNDRFDTSILDNHAFLNVPLMGKFLGVSSMTVRRMIKQGRLPRPFQWGEKVNSPYLWKTEHVKKFFTSFAREQAKAQMF